MNSYSVCLSLSNLLHLAWYPQGLCMFVAMARFLSLSFLFGYISPNSFVIPFCLSISLIWSRKWLMILCAQSIKILCWSYACFLQFLGILVMWTKNLHLTSHLTNLTLVNIYWESIICCVLFQWVRHTGISETASYLLVTVQKISSPKVIVSMFRLIMQAELLLEAVILHSYSDISCHCFLWQKL